MQHYVILGMWTDQGIRNVTSVPARINTTRGMIEKAGGKMQILMTMGRYDFVMLVDIPKDDDMAAILLCICSMGNIRTITMKAWNEEDAIKMLSSPHPSHLQ